MNSTQVLPTTTLVEVAEEMFQRALSAKRKPVCFTIGRDIEVRILWQLALQFAVRDCALDAMANYSIDSLSILGLPVRRMHSNGIALQTEAVFSGPS